jgi:membrane-bound lytic murein transglycosylase F
LSKRIFLWIALIAVSACGPEPSPPQQKSPHELVVAIRPGPTTWFLNADGDPAGFDRDLAALFAKEHDLMLRVIASDNPVQALSDPARGEADIAAGGLFGPERANGKAGDSLLYTTGYFAVEPLLVYNTDGFKPESWADLAGETVGIVEGIGLEDVIAKVRAKHPDVHWAPLTLAAAGGLIEQVAEGTLSYAIVGSNEAAAARNVFLNVEPAFAVGPKHDLVWVLTSTHVALRDLINGFFERIRKDGTLQRVIDRYFGYAHRVERIDAAVFQERMRSVLPAFSATFHQAQQETGIDWRLVAAIAYQESHWDPAAASATNVRGMMMLTEETAKRMRVEDRLDARQSIIGGARYMADLKRSLPGRIREPDRTWLALAAFNIGIGHLEDARVLAARRKLNPDSWSDLKKTLPVLAQPDSVDATKFGFARGGQAVVFVETVRAYYDVLLRLQNPYYGIRLKVSR